MQFLSNFFSIRLVSVHVVHPHSKIDITTTWKKLCFILSDWSYLDMIDNLLIAIHAFTRRILMSFSVDETLLSRYVNSYTNFRELQFSVEIKIHVLCFIYFHVEAHATWCLLQTMHQQGFSLGRCICKKLYVICVVCVRNSLCEATSACCQFLV